jgi:hypothetical protein
MALTDEGISDELLVEKLEALRCRSRAASIAGSDTDTVDWDHVWAAYDDELDADDVPPPPPPKDAAPITHAARTASMPALVSPSTTSWHSARRALLTCRELVRTERHYLASLHDLLDGATRVPPPPLMRAYAAALAKESAGLLRRMEEDPSAWGVAAAFVGAEDGVEAALVGWCGVVGGWFVDGERTPSRRLSKIRGVSEGAEEEEGVAKRSWGRRGSSRVSAVPSFLSLTSPPSAMSLTPEPPSPISVTRARSRRERDTRPAVRDLAILPTQRVMRYVLLYRGECATFFFILFLLSALFFPSFLFELRPARTHTNRSSLFFADLLEHTPVSSPPRALVARAVDAALRIAQRCDRAQENAAFLQRR